MKLWIKWIALVNALRTSCSRQRSFFWMIAVLIGFTIKFDLNGVTSFIRGIGLSPCYYTCMLHIFSSSAVDLIKLKELWVRLVITKFIGIVKLNGKLAIIGDGLKIGKEGKKMPGVKKLHQDSQNNKKAPFIMGHSIQVVSLLVQGLCGYLAVPLVAEIHEGFKFNSKKNMTLLDKMFDILLNLKLKESFYFIADKYYCSGRFLKQLINSGNHMITMMKTNAVAYYPPTKAIKNKRGRHKRYGDKVKLFSLFNCQNMKFISAAMPNDPKVIIQYCALELLWKPLGGLARFVFTQHPEKGNSIVMTTDLTMEPLEAIIGYGFRFKIEVMFKQAIYQIGTFMYRFWMKMMAPTKRFGKEKILQFAPKSFKNKVKEKQKAYNLFIQLGFIAQGLMQYLSIHDAQLVWNNFGSWLRTIRGTLPPSEKVVSLAMSNTFLEFLVDCKTEPIFKKFIQKRIDIGNIPGCKLAHSLVA